MVQDRRSNKQVERLYDDNTYLTKDGVSEFKAQDICYHMTPYRSFNLKTNPLIIVVDRFGMCLVNL